MRGCQDEWRLWFRSVVLPFLWASAWPCTSLTKNIRKICNLWGRSTTLWLPHLLSRLYSRYWTVSLISPLDKPFGRRLHRWTVLTGLGSLTFPPLLTRASFFFFLRLPDEKQSVWLRAERCRKWNEQYRWWRRNKYREKETEEKRRGFLFPSFVKHGTGQFL